jgi:hypothetical protein
VQGSGDSSGTHDKQLVSTDIYDDGGPAELTGFIRLSRYDSPG